MLKRLRLVLLTSVLTITLAAPARAEPISASIAAISAFAASSAAAGILVQVGLTLVTSLASSLISNMMPKPSKPGPNLAMRLSVSVGGVLAQAFIMGDYATAGSMAYRGSYGSSAGTPNAYYVEKRILSDVPMPALTGFMYGEVRATILWDQPSDKGYPIAQARVGGKDHMWIRYRDGTQTAADPYLRAQFGTHPTRPYTADMVGIGQAEAIVTRLVPPADNRDLFPANLDYIFETSGIRQYNVAKDSTAGGSGTHRRADPTTWEPSNLLPVAIYNILNGVYFGDEWLFGLQNTHASRLPASAWIAGINEAARRITLVGGGTEAQFTGGVEISVDTPAAAVIENLLTGCSGRLAEIGGVYKPLIGAPGAAVYSYTDQSIVVTRPQDYEPFPQIDNTYNGIRAKYREKAKGWQLADAPAYYSPELEVEDGGRYAADVTFETVTSNTQVQRLTKAAADAQRRWRKHQEVLPPIASELEPLDVVSKTSDHNGYTNKKFLITSMDDEPTFLQLVSLEEIDPEDYDWIPGVHERPRPVDEQVRDRPEPQVITAWDVQGAWIVNDAGVPVRPAVKFIWDGDVEDVRAVGFEVRTALGAEIDRVLVMSESTDAVAAGEAIFASARILPAQHLEGRGIYYPRGGRRTQWTGWIPFVTPDLRLSINDLDDAFGLITGVLEGTGSLGERFDDLTDRLDQLALSSMTIGTTLRQDAQNGRAQFRQQISVVADNAQSAVDFTSALIANLGESTAVSAQKLAVVANELYGQATFAQEVAAEYGGVTASGLMTMTARAGSAGWAIELAWIARATVDAQSYEAGLYVLLKNTGESAVAIKANSLYLMNDLGGIISSPFNVVGGIVYMADVRITGSLILDDTVTTNLMLANAVTGGAVFTQGSTVHVDNELVGGYFNVTYGSVKALFIGSQNRPSSGSGNFGVYTLRLYRDGVQINALPIFYDDNFSGVVAIAAVDTPGPGTFYYSAIATVNYGGGSFTFAAGGQLILDNFKR